MRAWSQRVFEGVRRFLCPPLEAPPSPLPLPLLLVTFPAAVAVAQTPWLVGMVAVATLFLAYHFHCLKAFLAIYGIAFLFNLPVLSAFAYHSDVDFYLGPMARQIAAGCPLSFDGEVRATHLLLPSGYAGWCAALYRLTGSLDLGHAQLFVLAVAAWQVLRQELNRWQTFALVCSPLTVSGVYNAMPDGCVYLLLLIALFGVRQGRFWLPLAAMAVAATYKTTAWFPCVLLGGLLFARFPRKWPQLLLAAATVAVLVAPTLWMIAHGGLNTILEDFLGADEAAQSMGHLGRLAYFYLGHWLVPGDYGFNVHIGGVDGAGMDGLGKLARLLIWLSLALLPLSRKRFASWWLPLAVAWGSVILMPTLYLGYGRYVPLAYIALMLPFVVRCPKVAAALACAMAVVPALWCAWRIMLSLELAQVVAGGGAVQSEWYNARAGLRSCGCTLVDAPQAVMSSSNVYTYAHADFPAIPADTPRGRLVPAGQKAMRLRSYAFTYALPWLATHTHSALWETFKIRWHWLTTFPRGAHDGLPATEPH